MACEALWGAPVCGWNGWCNTSTVSCTCQGKHNFFRGVALCVTTFSHQSGGAEGWEVFDFPVQGALLCTRKDVVVRAVHKMYAAIIWANFFIFNVNVWYNVLIKRKLKRWNLLQYGFMDIGLACLLVAVTRGFRAANGELLADPVSLACFLFCAACLDLANGVEVRNKLNAHKAAVHRITSTRGIRSTERNIDLMNKMKLVPCVYFVVGGLVPFVFDRRDLLLRWLLLLDLVVAFINLYAFLKSAGPVKRQLTELLDLTIELESSTSTRAAAAAREQPGEAKKAVLVDKIRMALVEIEIYSKQMRVFCGGRMFLALFAIWPLTTHLLYYAYPIFLVLVSFLHFLAMVGENSELRKLHHLSKNTSKPLTASEKNSIWSTNRATTKISSSVTTNTVTPE